MRWYILLGVFFVMLLPCQAEQVQEVTPSFAENATYNHTPLFSPDGRYIAFLKKINTRLTELWMMNADRTQEHCVYSQHAPRRTETDGENNAAILAYAWMPNSLSLICAVQTSMSWEGKPSTNEFDIRRVDNDGTMRWRTQLPRYPTGTPAISSDGRFVAYVVESALVIFDTADGKEHQRITAGMEHYTPRWERDRLYCAIVPMRHLAPWPPRDLIAVTPDGKWESVTQTPKWEEIMPSVSPDGQWLAFLRSEPQANHDFHLFNKLINPSLIVKRLDTGEERQIIQGADGYLWMPDGRLLVATGFIAIAAQRQSYDIYTVTGKRTISLIAGLKFLVNQLPGIWPKPLDGANEIFLPGRKDGYRFPGSFLPTVSPDGKTMAYECDGIIYTIDLGTIEELN